MGGRIFLQPTHLPATAAKLFALCPHGLHPQDAAALERASPCFAAVHPSCRVTMYWLRSCWQVGNVEGAALVWRGAVYCCAKVANAGCGWRALM